MIPDPDPNPAAAYPTEPAFHAAFRRGRALVWLVVGVTAFFILQDVRLDQWNNQTSKAVRNGLLFGCICWCALRGGTVSTGCLTVFYGAMVLCYGILIALIVPAVGMVIGTLLAELVRHAGHLPPPNLAVEPHDGQSGNGLQLLAGGTCAVFSLWVLAFSKDARVYRRVRRHGFAEAERLSLEWPPHRR